MRKQPGCRGQVRPYSLSRLPYPVASPNPLSLNPAKGGGAVASQGREEPRLLLSGGGGHAGEIEIDRVDGCVRAPISWWLVGRGMGHAGDKDSVDGRIGTPISWWLVGRRMGRADVIDNS